jgi:hypothetical protein
MIRGLQRVLQRVSISNCNGKERRTPHLLEALAVEFADGAVLFLQLLQAARQRVRQLEAVVALVVGIGLVVVERNLHLANRPDQALGLLGHLVLLVGRLLELVVERLRQRREELHALAASAGSGKNVTRTSASRESRSWLATPISSYRP